MRVLLAIATAAALCFAATESRVSRASILAVEHSINEKFETASTDPLYVLGDAHGTYLEGYGVVFTSEVNLINNSPMTPNPFKQTVSQAEIAASRERKLKNYAVLRDSMRSLMVNASAALEGLPANEHIAIETKLFTYSWEDNRVIPHRLFMTAVKQKLLDAKAVHAGQTELASIIEEQER